MKSIACRCILCAGIVCFIAPLTFPLMVLIFSPGGLLPLNSLLAALSRTIQSGKFALLATVIS